MMYKVFVYLLFLFFSTGKAFASPTDAPDEYDAIRNKWKNILIGTDGNTTGKYIEAKKAFITTDAQKHWHALNKQQGRTHLWPDLTSTTLSAEITHGYRRIYAMALAYSTPGTPLAGDSVLRNDIIGALEWMHVNRYVKSYNDWWDFAIGAPLELNNCITLLYDDLSPAQRINFNERVAKFAGDPTTDFGANRAWRAFVYGLNGVLKKDSAKIAFAKNALSALFEYVAKGEGFYTDGSFIQHGNHPYNLGYGVSAISRLSDLMYLLDGTTWKVTDSNSKNMYRWIYDAFEPFVYKGVGMDMVRGREIARWYREDYSAGFAMIGIVANLAQFAPQPDATNFKRLVKHWVTANNQRNYFSDAAISATTSLNTIRQVQAIIEDESIIPKADTVFYKQFPMMDRAVKVGKGFAVGISMHSTRIANYEADIKAENIQGWHTGDGMTYLYNADLNQYSNHFWPTVDNYRLPGTTVLQQTTIASDKVNDRAWVGGVSLANTYGVTGMDYGAIGYSLRAKKSWFLFDDEIVALGAGINSTDGKAVETIVENRKLNDKGTNPIMINGNALLAMNVEKENTLTSMKYVHFSGTVTGSDVGYYFPGNTALKRLREKRTGSWKSVNSNPASSDSTLHSNYYFTLWFDHGVNPASASYSYVLLPGKSAKEVSRYADNPQITILRNDTLVQAVKEMNVGILGANFWTDTEQSVDKIGCNKKAAVMMEETTDGLIVSVSDPTMLNTGFITLKIKKTATTLVFKSDAITVVQLRPAIILRINVAGAKGASFEARFK